MLDLEECSAASCGPDVPGADSARQPDEGVRWEGYREEVLNLILDS